MMLKIFPLLLSCSLAYHNLTVHLVPHSHTDIGWQSTLESYFYSTKMRAYFQGFAGVNNVLTTVIDSLLSNPTRRFSWSEMKYFQLWWRE